MEDVMDLKEAMEYLGFKNAGAFRNNCKEKNIPCRKFGGEYFFSRNALNIWLSGADIEEVYEKVAQAQIEKALETMA